MIAKEIAAALGGGQRSGDWWRCHCPVHGNTSASLAFRDGERALIVHCHAGCARADILAELRRRGLLDGDPVGIDPPADPAEIERHRNAEALNRRQRVANALDLWSECYPTPRTIVERYWHSRGLADPIPPTIRMHGMMRHRESGARRPAMAALVEHVEHGPVGIHITYLAIDGSIKATVDPVKRAIGPVGGGAVRLAHVESDRELVIAEGLETSASVMQATGLPSWAALSANGIRSLVLPLEARNVLIAADNDVNGVGERAAQAAARRWLAEGRRVRIAMPPLPGMDFADVLLGRTRGRFEDACDVAA